MSKTQIIFEHVWTTTAKEHEGWQDGSEGKGPCHQKPGTSRVEKEN